MPLHKLTRLLKGGLNGNRLQDELMSRLDWPSGFLLVRYYISDPILVFVITLTIQQYVY